MLARTLTGRWFYVVGKCAKGELEQEGYYSLVTFREVFFVNVVHRKPENCGAKSCECMISVHRGVRCCERSEQ